MDNKATYNQGYNDGKKSKSLLNPIHRNWPPNHPNQFYEQGYWDGYFDRHCGYSFYESDGIPDCQF